MTLRGERGNDEVLTTADGARLDVAASNLNPSQVGPDREAAPLPDAVRMLYDWQERGRGGGGADRATVDVAASSGHDQAERGGRRGLVLDLLPHVPSDGTHGVPSRATAPHFCSGPPTRCR